MKPQTKRQVNILVTPEQKEALEGRSRELNIGVSVIVRALVSKFLSGAVQLQL